MAEQNIKETQMEINANITDAARQLVRISEIEEGIAYDIPNYRGMCVAFAEEKDLFQPLSFFTEGNRRYAIGARTK